MLKLNSDNIVDVSTNVFDYRGVKRGAEKCKIWRSYFYTSEHIEMLQNVGGDFFGVGARFKNKAATENDLLNVITHLKRSAERENPPQKVSIRENNGLCFVYYPQTQVLFIRVRYASPVFQDVSASLPAFLAEASSTLIPVRGTDFIIMEQCI
jgi:hypothetical protein